MLSFQPVQALVERCDVVKKMENKRGTQSPIMFWTIQTRFKYQVEGTVFEGTEFSNIPLTSRAEAESDQPPPSPELLKACLLFAEGTVHNAMYDTKNPATAYLSLQLWTRWWLWVAGPALLVLGIYLKP